MRAGWCSWSAYVESINTLNQEIAKDMLSSETSVETLSTVTEKMSEMVSGFKTGEGSFDDIISWAQETRDHFQEEIQAIRKSRQHLPNPSSTRCRHIATQHSNRSRVEFTAVQ